MKHSVDIVIPVLNEEEVLEKNAIILNNFLSKNCKIPWQVTIFSNGSTDRTVEIGNRLAKRYPRIKFIHIPEKGRAKALKLAWMASKASILGYMDADLSTDLNAFPTCIDAIVNGEADISIGNRLSKESQTERCLKREIISRVWNTMIRSFFPKTKIVDSQCGFKFMRANVLKQLLPHIKDKKFFFDTEMLMLAENGGYRIKQVPVKWIERKASKVKLVKTITDYIFRLAELRLRVWKTLMTRN